MISGRHPFERETSDETLHAIQLGRAIELPAARPDSPEAVLKLFERVLARGRSRRPSTARELAHLIRSAAEAVAA